MKKTLLILLLLMHSGICKSTEEAIATETPEDIYANHAGSSERLRFIMRNLNSAYQESKHSDIRKDRIVNDNMAEMLEAIEKLLSSTELMANVKSGLDESKRDIFKSLVSQLYTETLNLQQISNNYEYQRIPSAYQRLNQTCEDCHRLFREQ